jgi:hypothetical protein
MVALMFVVRPAATADASSPSVHAKGTGGSDFTEDPYIARHAEVVEYLRQHNAR